MATTIDAAELARALRIDADDADETAEAARLAAVAIETVDERAPDAPAATRREAVYRIAGYLYDAPHAVSPSAWRHSGAAALLAPWILRRAMTTAEDGG